MSYVVISRVKFPVSHLAEIESAGKALIEIVKAQEGLIHAAFHIAQSADETMMYMEWYSPQYHQALFESPQWLAVMADHQVAFDSPDVTFNASSYQRVDV